MDLELQKTLFALFNSLEFPFYEDLQEGGFPYGSIGYHRLERLNTKTSKGYKASYQLDLYSLYNGSKEVKEMCDAVILLLETPFECGGHNVSMRSDWSFQVQLEEQLRHGILEVEFEIY